MQITGLPSPDLLLYEYLPHLFCSQPYTHSYQANRVNVLPWRYSSRLRPALQIPLFPTSQLSLRAYPIANQCDTQLLAFIFALFSEIANLTSFASVLHSLIQIATNQQDQVLLVIYTRLLSSMSQFSSASDLFFVLNVLQRDKTLEDDLSHIYHILCVYKQHTSIGPLIESLFPKYKMYTPTDSRTFQNASFNNTFTVFTLQSA